MIDAWLQKADYSSEEYAGIARAGILALWSSLDMVTLDRQQRALEQGGADFCPWGLGLGHDSDVFIHVYRESIDHDTFAVLIRRKRRWGRKEETQLSGVDRADVHGMLEAYFDEVGL